MDVIKKARKTKNTARNSRTSKENSLTSPTRRRDQEKQVPNTDEDLTEERNSPEIQTRVESVLEHSRTHS